MGYCNEHALSSSYNFFLSPVSSIFTLVSLNQSRLGIVSGWLMCVQSGAGANTFLPILSFASLLRWCLLLLHRLDVVLFPDVRAVTALLERGSVSFRVPLVVELWYGGARSFGTVG